MEAIKKANILKRARNVTVFNANVTEERHRFQETNELSEFVPTYIDDRSSDVKAVAKKFAYFNYTMRKMEARDLNSDGIFFLCVGKANSYFWR